MSAWADMLRDEISEANDRLTWYRNQPNQTNAAFVGLVADNIVNYAAKCASDPDATELLTEANALIERCRNVEREQRAADAEVMADGTSWLGQVV